MPMSSELAHAMLEQLRIASTGRIEGPEMEAIKPLLEIQQRWSALPTDRVRVVETKTCREGEDGVRNQ
jgi:ATP-dependent Lhr-like helicase